MTSALSFTTNSLFENTTVDKGSDSWNFSFAHNIYVSASGFWRLLKKNKIVFVSLDNEHQFALPKPLDLSHEVNKELAGKCLTRIEVDKNYNSPNVDIDK